MKKRLILTAAGLLAAASFTAASAFAADVSLVIDGTEVNGDTAPQITAEGRTIVPLRVIAESLGAKVDWEAEEKTVTIEKDAKTLIFTIGADSMKNDGKDVSLDSPAQIVNGRTMVPIRVISESFGCVVDWDAETKTVTISSGAKPENITPDDGKEPEEDSNSKLPAYKYSGEDAITGAACDGIIKYTKDQYEKADVSIPCIHIYKTDDSDEKDVKVWGRFEVWNYILSDDVLECTSGGAYVGIMHFGKTDNGYKFTSFDSAADGEDYADSIKELCGGDKELEKQMLKDESDDTSRREFISEYAKSANLNVTAYHDFGWPNISIKDGKEDNSSSFDIELPSFYFASGVGAWDTGLVVCSDGSFLGDFHDTNMGEDGDGYPNGTVYFCDFSGRFTDIKKNSDGTYSMKLGFVKTNEAQEYIDEGVKYIPAEPYGVEEGKEFILYTPDTPIKGLDEEFLSWWPGSYDGKEHDTLGYYGIFNKDTGYGFFGNFED